MQAKGSPTDTQDDADHDQSGQGVQRVGVQQLRRADLRCAVIAWSTRARIRRNTVIVAVGKPAAPSLLRTAEKPRGCRRLRGADRQRGERASRASDFIVAGAVRLAEQGKAAIQGNPSNSLCWEDPEERRQMAAG